MAGPNANKSRLVKPLAPTRGGRPTHADACGPLDLAHLERLSLAALRALWSERMGRAAAPAQKRLLVRELAWRDQERTNGGLDAETRRLLNAAVRAAQRARDAQRPRSGASTDATIRARAQRPKAAAASRRIDTRSGLLLPGARLVRVWRGVAHEVEVLGDGRGNCKIRGYRYGGEVYRSLSEVARVITGARWSGPRFFGLATRAQGDRPTEHTP